jgi:hypothetical protein
MLVELSKLKPNPFRVFKVDPIDQEAVKTLTESIEQDGFWGGVVCRINDNGDIEVAAGHHRVAAAIQAGLKKADVFIGELDDKAMIRIYARENATQRGNHSTAVAGTVASAVRFLAKAQFLFTGEFTSERQGGAARDGIGRDAICELLVDVPGVTQNSVKEQLANIKKSGDYASIIREVQEEADRILKAEQERIARAIREEEKRRKEAEAEAKRRAEEADKAQLAYEKRLAEAKKRADEAAAAKLEADRLAAERKAEEEAKRKRLEAEAAKKRQEQLDAERAALQGKRQKAIDAVDKAEEQEVEFDFAGVAAAMKNESQVRAFRDIALSVGVKPYLAVDQQASVAKAIVDKLAEDNKKYGSQKELTSAYIREWFYTSLFGIKKDERTDKRNQTKAELERLDRQSKAKRLQHEFARYANGLSKVGSEFSDLVRTAPKGEAMPITDEFKKALKTLEWTVGLLKQRKLI